MCAQLKAQSANLLRRVQRNQPSNKRDSNDSDSSEGNWQFFFVRHLVGVATINWTNKTGKKQSLLHAET
jgi:hypothetical protein